MKTKILRSLALAAFLSTINSELSTAFAQGSLTPPGAPAPTMKTLAQIEPRTPISSAPFTISIPGSYYLTTNVFASSNAIVITANGVTLDLGGWTITSTAPNAATGGTAILLGGTPALHDITILNGHIRGGVTNNGGVFSGGGFNNGITYSLNSPVNVLVSRVSVTGCLNLGIFFINGDSDVVEFCTVRTIGFEGIQASIVKSCEAVDCGNYGIIGDQISDCSGAATGTGSGIYATTTAQNCSGQNTGNGTGLFAITAQNCYGLNTGIGIGMNVATAHNCYSGCVGSGTGLVVIFAAQNCVSESTGGSAINIGDGGTLTSCSAYISGTGISAGKNCTIKDCTASNNSTNGIMAGQSCQISGCTVIGNGTNASGFGISVGSRSTVQNCTVNDNRGDGILATNDCMVLNNHASHNALGSATAAGIHTSSTGSRIDGNQTRNNAAYGIKSDGGADADVIIRNTSSGNSTAQYFPTIGGSFAPVQSPATATSPWANF